MWHQSGTIHSVLAAVNFRGVSSTERPKLDGRRVVNVIIAKDFNLAQEDVQIQALEVRLPVLPHVGPLAILTDGMSSSSEGGESTVERLSTSPRKCSSCFPWWPPRQSTSD